MKAALIGAGEESLHMIEKAKELGVFVTALDGNPAAPGLRAADEGLAVDISQEEAVLAALAERKPDFVLTGPIGRYLTTAGAVNDALGLRGISRKAAVACTDKYLFHQILSEQGLRAGHCWLIPALDDAKDGEKGEDRSEREPKEPARQGRLSYPAILKPRYGSGSRGIFFVESPMELALAMKALQHEEEEHKIPLEDYVLEEAAKGEEYGVDGAMDGKTFRLILLRRKLLTPPPARQAVGYFSVTGTMDREEALLGRVQEYLERVTERMGLQDCLLHADLMISENNIFVIELSARPSGHNLHNLFTPMATGVDMAQQYIRSQCGMPYSYQPLYRKKLLIRYFALPEGRIDRVPKAEELRLPDSVSLRRWNCMLHPGESVGRVTTGHSVMGRGYFILEGESDEELEAAADGVLGEFVVKKLW